MRSRIDGLIRLVVLHLAIACVSSVAGGLDARNVSGGIRTPGLLWEEAGPIYANNLRSLAVLAAAGAVLVGASGIVVFALNGYYFGQMLVSSDVPLTGLWLFAPLELMSFAVGAAAAMRMGLDVVRRIDGLLSWAAAAVGRQLTPLRVHRL
jgi:uncharacterized membrane protein SpoIIM required for sporulation